MLVATSFPYLLNFAFAPLDGHYTWIIPPYPQDSFGYLAWSQQAAHGKLLFQIKYTAIPHSAFLFNPFFLICGWLSRLLATNIAIIQFAMKQVGVVLFFLIFYRYVDYLGLSALESVVASVMVGITSGFGGAMAFFGWSSQAPKVSADLWIPEVNTYWSLLWNPLFSWSLALMLLVIFLLDRGSREDRRADFWLAGVVSGTLALIHPYTQPLLLAFAIVVIAVRKRTAGFGYLLRYLVAVAPPLLYLYLASVRVPIVSQHSWQGTMDSPSLIWYLLGFGAPLLICAAGVFIRRGRWMKQYWQLAPWFGLSLCLAYVPVWFQRKLVLGSAIPLCILAAVCCGMFVERWPRLGKAKWLLTAFAILMTPLLISTPICLLAEDPYLVRNDIETYYLSSDLSNALDFLKQHSQPEQIVFANPATSRMIPAFAGNTVLWGHWAMAVDFAAQQQRFQELFVGHQNWDDEERAKKFWEPGIDYIFADRGFKTGMEEHPWQWRVILKNADEVFHNRSVVIYKRRTGY